MTVLIGQSASLSIAGFDFHVTSPSLPLAVPDEPAYGEFASPAGSTAPGGTIPVHVRTGSVPLFESGSIIFESGETWRLSGEGGKKTIYHGANGRDGRPLWAAELSEGMEGISVICGTAMERTVDGVQAIENPLRYPLDQILVMLLLGEEGVIVHAAGAVRDGRAVVLAGVSGAGKTTVSRRLQEGGYALLSDDRVIIRRDGGGFAAHGTPWPGEGGFASRSSAPLERLCLLEKGDRDTTRELPPREALERLLPTLSLPWFDRSALDGPLRFLDGLLRTVPVMELTFTEKSGTVPLFSRRSLS